jgi:hypothetical protein
MMQEYEGRVSVGHTHNDVIQIDLEDKVTGRILFRLTMTPEEFGRVVTGFASRPCQFTVYKQAVELVGEEGCKPIQNAENLPY